MANEFNVDAPLLMFSSDKGKTPFTIKQSFSGIAIFGTTGGGKSSSSAALIARKMLLAGYGGLVLTVKEDEKDRWLKFAKDTGRMDDVMVIEEGGQYTFNWLDWVASMGKGSYAANIVRLLSSVINLVNERKQTGSNDSFWLDATQQLIKNVIDLCLLAYGKLSVRDMYELIVCAPHKDKHKASGEGPNSFDRAYNLAVQNVNKQIEAWKVTLSPSEQELNRKDRDRHDRLAADQVKDAARLQAVDQFFGETFRNLADKTRSIVFFNATTCLSHLLEEPVNKLFNNDQASNFSPEDCFKGKVLILHLPVKIHYDAGNFAQCIFKVLFQRCCERRNIEQEGRPVFLYQDEAQFFFMSDTDPLFQATARSSRVCSVLISQSLSSYYSMIGGDSFKGQHKVKVLLGVLALKIFHANEGDTNIFASELCGQGYVENISRDSHFSEDFSQGRSSSWVLEPFVRPEFFNYLRCGGPPDFLVDAYVHRLDGLFSNGLNFQKIVFRQF